jgi:hypothetical protein
VRLGTRVARLLGSRFGALAYEIEDDSGAIVTMAVSATAGAHIVAIAPAVLAARRIAAGTFEETGLVPVDRQVDPVALCGFLATVGVSVQRNGAPWRQPH